MEVSYERTLDRVSLILKDGSVRETDGFETKMVCVGGVPGLLPMSVRKMNGETAYVYDVTARQPLSEYLKGRQLAREELAQILETVLEILEELEVYLLDAGRLMFSTDKIFAQGSYRDLRLCYVPSHSQPMREGFYGLVMELIPKTDPKDRAAVVLGYRFAHELQGENVSCGDLRRCLHAGAEAAGEPALYAHAFGDIQRNPGEYAGPGQDGAAEAWAGEPGDTGWERPDTNDREAFSPIRERKKTGPRAKPWISRRTILVIVIGGAVLLTAFFCMHTELAETLLSALPAHPLFLGGSLLVLAFAAGLILLWRKRAPVRARNPFAAGAAPESFPEDGGETAAASASRGEKTGRGAFHGAFADSIPTGKSAAAEDFSRFGGRKTAESAALSGKDFYAARRNTGEGDLATCVLAPPDREAAARLTPRKDTGSFETLLLQKNDILLGKQQDLVDLVIPSPVISRVHAHICRRKDAWYITDLNSRNGTALNGELLESMREARLCDGDIVRFADLEYLFKAAED